ncbi:unnamed protein product [Orchesella dallaii]|uniref:Uncharacterized protein n=1 Tax=Orchesella dallaii TaxID=48710 RepID=A0ABP1RBW9_9HEXA
MNETPKLLISSECIRHQHVIGRRYSVSVVQSLFNREYGFPFYTQGHGFVSNFHNEKWACRQLIQSRTPSGNVGVAARPHSMTLRCTIPTTNRNSWINVDWQRRCCKIRFEDGVFWENEGQWTPRSVRGNTDRFFTLHADGFKLDAEYYCDMYGGFAETLVFHENLYLPKVEQKTSISSKSSHLVMLVHTGWVRMYDLAHRRKYCQLRLRARLRENVTFESINCDDSTDDIFVMATLKGKVKYVYCLNYNDGALSLKSVINFGFEASMTLLSGRMIALRDSKCNDLSSLDLLIRSNCDYVEGEFSDGSLQSVEVTHVSEKPTILERVPLQDFDFGSGLWEPHAYGIEIDKCLCLLTTKILQLENLNTLWERSINCFSLAKIKSFPDNSPRFLYSANKNYEIISLKRNLDDSIVAESSQPFDISKESEATSAVRSERARHTRSCETKQESVSTEVLGMAHCSELDLIAVCSRKQSDDMQIYIGLYETKKLKLLKMLPPLLAWPGSQGRNTMANFDLSFTMELIVVIMDYGWTIKHDVFFMQLL